MASERVTSFTCTSLNVNDTDVPLCTTYGFSKIDGIDEEPNPAFTVDASVAVKFAYVSEIEILGICDALAAFNTERA